MDHYIVEPSTNGQYAVVHEDDRDEGLFYGTKAECAEYAASLNEGE